MPPVSTVSISFANYLTNGWIIQGDTQGLGNPNTVPASANPTAVGGWWGTFGTFPQFAGSVLFFWFDAFVPPYVRGPWVRTTWIQKTFDGSDPSLNWVAGQEIGVRLRSNWTLDTGPGNMFLEVTGAETRRVSGLTSLFDFWTIPVDGSNNQKDNYVVITVPPSLLVTVRAGGENYAPSSNVYCVFTELELGIYEPPVVPPPPEPEVPAPPCSPLDILMRAQEETGHRWRAWTPALEHLERYAKQLLSRCMAAWYGNEKGDESIYEFDLTNITTGSGWGFNWGLNWGGGLSVLAGSQLAFQLPDVPEAVWEVEARRIGQVVFEPINLVATDDLESNLEPRCTLRDNVLTLYNFNSSYVGVFDMVRLRVTRMHTTLSNILTIAPNDHIGPLFCRACELEMSRELAFRSADRDQQRYLRRELQDVTRRLMDQSRSQRDIETARTERR